MSEKRILSGIRPTGMLHIGNYWGSIHQLLQFQQQNYQSFYFVADLHALTTIDNNKNNFNQQSLTIARGYLACGIDPDKAIIYRQSAINKIPYLANLLSMITSESWLRKCTTYKEKKAKIIPSVGLLSYPVLMAADIIIMDADIVPVGHDQLQHLEMARDIALKFNNMFGETFKLPDTIKINALRIKGLDGASKMGKSENNYIGLFENPKQIQKKIMSVVTDSGNDFNTPMPPGLAALYQLLKLHAPKNVYQEYLDMYKQKKEKFYGQLKKDLASHIIKFIEPLQEKFNQLSDDFVQDVLNSGAKKAIPIAEATFNRAFKNLNL